MMIYAPGSCITSIAIYLLTLPYNNAYIFWCIQLVEQMCGYDQLRFGCTAWSTEGDAEGKCDDRDDDDGYDDIDDDDNGRDGDVDVDVDSNGDNVGWWWWAVMNDDNRVKMIMVIIK